MTRRKTQVLLFSGAALLTVLLFIAPRTIARQPATVSENEMSGEGIEGVRLFRSMAEKSLAPSEKKKFDRLTHNHQFDSLQDFWFRMKRPDLIALTAEEKALKSGKASDYFEAGTRYYNAVRFTSDNARIPVLFRGAIRNLEKGLKKEPNDTSAQVLLANCYVEGSADPMKGITLLRELEQADSSNISVQLSLGMFAVKSGQLDKAVQRFQKVLALDSTYIEAWLHMADAFEKQGDINGTIRSLEQYEKRTDDAVARIEVKKYIEQLKSK